MNEEKFQIRIYGKSELVMLYFPNSSKETAMRKFRSWLKFNPILRHITKKKRKYFLVSEVKKITEELGEPFEI